MPIPRGDAPDEEAEQSPNCGRPCPPERGEPCDDCREYWQRMRREGYWTDDGGWTEKAKEEWKR